MYNKEIIGKEVISSDGWTVGRVVGVLVDLRTWQVPSLEVQLADGGAGTMPSVMAGPDPGRALISSTQIQGVDDKLTLKVPRKDIIVSPTAS